MDGWLSSITGWLLELFKSAFTSLYNLIHDLILWPFVEILQFIATTINGFTPPAFMASGNNFGQLLGGLPSFALFVVNQMQFDVAFGIVGAGVAFRLLRKLFTLGQW